MSLLERTTQFQMFSLVSLLPLLSLPFVTAADCPGDTVLVPEMGACLIMDDEEMNFWDGDKFCQSMGGHLVSLHNAFENTLIDGMALTSLAHGQSLFYMGGYKSDNGTWLWTDGSPFSYSKWSPGDSQTGCLVMEASTGLWRSIACSIHLPFFCSLPNVQPTAGCVTGSPVALACPSEWTYFEESRSCYYLGFEEDWQTAESTCVEMGAHLASIHGNGENTFVARMGKVFAGCDRPDGTNWNQIWLGGVKNGGNSGKWSWTDGSVVDYVNFLIDGVDRTSMISDATCYNYYGKWAAISSNTTLTYYVCKKPALI